MRLRRIAVLTSGGDSPGMNAALRAVIRTAVSYNIQPYVVYDGYKGLVNDNIVPVDYKFVADIINRGGTILRSARLPQFKQLANQQKAIANLRKHDIDSLIVIGGDGTYRGAYDLTKLGINCIGIPATIDNDVAGTDYTIGFDTALNTIIECVDKLRDTSSSHQRCSVIEVMGRNCGDLALYAGIACGAEYIVSSHVEYDEIALLERLKQSRIHGKVHNIVIVTENITNVYELSHKIETYTQFEARATILGHIQRGGQPSASDRVLASRMGIAAVEAMINYEQPVAIAVRGLNVIATSLVEIIESKRKAIIDLYQKALKIS